MPLSAYRDSDRTQTAFAKELELNGSPEEKAGRFYCQSPECSASMIFVASSSSHCAHFRALPSVPHTENCVYGRFSEYDPNKFDERSFDFKNFIQYLDQEQKTPNQQTAGCGSEGLNQNKKPLTTLHQVYGMLKSHDPKERLGGQKVSSMLLDDRSFDEYYDHFYGSHIIEAKVIDRWSFAEERTVPNGVQLNSLEIPERQKYYSTLHLTLRVKGKSIIFSVCFKDAELFETLKNQIKGSNTDYKAFDKPFVVVAGNWKLVPGTHHHYTTVVKNKKQIFCF